MAKIEAVLDAGPLIHLAELDALDALDDLILRIPNTVWEEVANRQPRALEYLRDRLHRVSVKPSTELQTLAQALSLDRGEVEALSLMEIYPSAWFLTDDAAARLAAEQRGYPTHETIGLLIRMVRCKRRTPQQILDLLRAIPKRSTLYIRLDLLNAIIQRLEQEWLQNTPRNE